MKYKDYYAILGLERNASDGDIKRAYRKLARKYHPDVSKEPHAEEKFKEVSEAYETLKDPEKRAAYEQLGRYQTGQEFRPPPDWEQRFGAGGGPFGDHPGALGGQAHGPGGLLVVEPLDVAEDDGQALLGRKVDDEITIKRPAGDLTVTIVAVTSSRPGK